MDIQGLDTDPGSQVGQSKRHQLLVVNQSGSTNHVGVRELNLILIYACQNNCKNKSRKHMKLDEEKQRSI